MVDDDEFDLRLTVGNIGKKKKRGFSIYEDRIASQNPLSFGLEGSSNRSYLQGYGNPILTHQHLQLPGLDRSNLPVNETPAGGGYFQDMAAFRRPQASRQPAVGGKENVGRNMYSGARMEASMYMGLDQPQAFQRDNRTRLESSHRGNETRRHLGRPDEGDLFGYSSNPLTPAFQQPWELRGWLERAGSHGLNQTLMAEREWKGSERTRTMKEPSPASTIDDTDAQFSSGP